MHPDGRPNDSFGPMGEVEVLLLLGGDRGDVSATLTAAERLIGECCGRVLARSRDHWTEPWGFSDPELFLNRALLLATDRSPQDLMHLLLGIEQDLGRVRDASAAYGPRPVDLDILFVGGMVIEEPGLRIPHPLMHERAFALAPAADVAPAMRHPLLGRTVLEMLNDLRMRQGA